jgi:PAS domain S-box-containing protein
VVIGSDAFEGAAAELMDLPMDIGRTQLIESIFAGEGEMRERMRALDWSTTALGPPEKWSRSLRLCVRIVLGSGYPMTIYWGPDYTMLYNDACRQVMGTKHPAALGRAFRKGFPEVWDSVRPLLDKVMTQGEDVSTLTDQLFLLNRNGYLEECYFVTSFSPIPDDTGEVGGVLNTALETTERVIEDRRRQLLRDLASRVAETRDEDVVWRVSAETFREHRLSVPFALLYAYRPAEGRAHLAGTSVEASGLDPAVIDCTNQNPWRFDAALPLEGFVVELGSHVLALPKFTWPTPLENATVVPVRLREDSDTLGFLVLGIHPGRAFDDTYREFVRRIAEQIAIGLASARAYEQERLRRKAEALQASEHNLAAIINTIPTAAWTARPDGYCDFINQVWLDYTGISAEKAQGRGWTEAIHPDDHEQLVGDWQSCLASGIPVDTEARIRRFDSSYRWFLIRANPLRGESGNILKWYGTCIDIEDRKRWEQILRARELSWKQIVDNIPGLVASTDAMGEVVFLNRQTLEYFGKTNDELKDWSLIGVVHPDDLPSVIEGRKKSIELGHIYEIEHRCRRADGAFRWFQVRGLPVRDEKGQITAWYLLLIDIDDRKKAEAQVEQSYLRLAEAQRLSKTGSFITDLVADQHNWSEETYRIFDFDPVTKVSVQMIRDLIHPEDLPSFDAMIGRALTGVDVDFVFRIVTSSGAVKHIRGMARVIEQIAGRPLFIGALQDVTEGKVAEEALNRARSELAHVARITTLNALTASIAHEINQPLASLITNASICLRRLNADPPNVDGARETAMRTIRDGNRTSDVIARLRALYSKKEFTPEPLDLNEATREVIALSMSDLQRNRVILKSELADSLPLVTGDRVQLQQVILNLVRNGSEAMSSVDDRPRELFIRTEREGADGVRLSVKDVGVGLAPEAADKLFQAFYTTKKDGMGIGLHVSQSIIEAHHGRLWAIANDGPGATFSFAIPRRRESVAEENDSDRTE